MSGYRGQIVNNHFDNTGNLRCFLTRLRSHRRDRNPRTRCMVQSSQNEGPDSCLQSGPRTQAR